MSLDTNAWCHRHQCRKGACEHAHIPPPASARPDVGRVYDSLGRVIEDQPSRAMRRWELAIEDLELIASLLEDCPAKNMALSLAAGHRLQLEAERSTPPQS